MEPVYYRIAYRCLPFKARTHFLWIKTPAGTDKDGVYKYIHSLKGQTRLPIDTIDEINSFAGPVEPVDYDFTERPHTVPREDIAYIVADKLMGKGTRDCKAGSPYDIQRRRIEDIVNQMTQMGFVITEIS